MKPFQKKLAQNIQDKPLRPLLRPKGKMQNTKNKNQSLERRNVSKKKQQPLQNIQKSKQKLTRQFIFKYAVYWSNKQNSLSKVKSLVLRDQQLFTFQSTETFKLHQLSTIQLLSLSHNHISSLHPLSELDSLISLNLNNNQIYEISPLSFLVNLQALYANNNKIKQLTSLNGLEKLTVLHVYNNCIVYKQKQFLVKLTKRLSELDIQKNEVFKEQQKDQWLQNNLYKLNGQAICRKQKNMQTNLNLTSSSFFRNTAVDFRNTKTSFQKNNSLLSEDVDIQKQIQESELRYIKLDNEYEDQIAKNARLKEQLHQKLLKKESADKQEQLLKERQHKIKQMEIYIQSIKQNLFSKGQNPLLKHLYELTTKYENNKIEKKYAKQNSGKLDLSQIYSKLQINERSFQADEQIEIQDSEDQIVDSDEQINQILNQNSQTLQELRQQLRQMQ